jgi:putative endonuclease
VDKRRIGNIGERVAADYISAMNCDILEKNYFTKDGEIDIIFKDGDTLVFAEVKYRSTDLYGKPAEAVTLTKRKRISKTALHYLYDKGLNDEKCRFDIFEVTGAKMICRQIKNAFEAQI